MPKKNKGFNKNKKWNKISNDNSSLLHEELHIAIKNGNLPRIQQLLAEGNKLCYENKTENCYILAQDNGDPMILTSLLKHDASGVNTVHSDGYSLLMRDITLKDKRGNAASVHIQLLIDKGADVNYSDEHGYTAFHLAIKYSNIDAIKKLINLNVNVNTGMIDPEKMSSSVGETPLIFAIKFHHFLDSYYFEKIKLLIEAGADVNLANSSGRTPLMFAANTHPECSFNGYNNCKIIKYLLDHGAKAGIYDVEGKNAISRLVWKINYFSLYMHDHDVAVIEEYFDPAINWLIEAGDDLGNSLEVVLKNLFLYKHKTVHPTIAKILSLTDEEFKKNLVMDFKWKSGFEWMQGISVIEAFVMEMPLADLKNWLIKLHEENFAVNRKDRLLYILWKRRMHTTETEELIEITDYLIENQYEVCGPISMCPSWIENRRRHVIPVVTKRMKKFIEMLNVPFCLWSSAAVGNIECLKKFLPYWNQPPLALILCLPLFPAFKLRSEKLASALESVEKIIPVLYEYGGALSPGTMLYIEMKNLIAQFEVAAEGRYILEEDDDVFDSEDEDFISFLRLRPHRSYTEYHLNCYRKISALLTTLHASPASLQILCRTVVRANAIFNGDDLPNKMKALVPPPLEGFMAISKPCI